ncbi:MAG TPA: hypothetical protein VGJ08_01820 [Rhizomicrobium sp.]|jgi:hypothetical protein
MAALRSTARRRLTRGRGSVRVGRSGVSWHKARNYPSYMNTKPHLTFKEFLLLQDIGEGNDEQNMAKKERLHRLLSLHYIRAVEGSYFLTPYGERRIRNGN